MSLGRGLAGARILLTTDAVGGVWTYALDLARGLTGRGLHVSLAVLGPGLSADAQEAARAIDGVDLVETGLPLDWTATDEAAILGAGAALAGLARDVGADLVHLNSPAFAAGGGFDRPVLGFCHSCVTTWWAAVRGTPLPPDFAWRAALVERGYRAVDALLAPSRAFTRATAATYGIPAPTVVFNGSLPRSAGSGETAEPIVLTAGRLWDEGKGVALLDRAAAGMTTPIWAAGPTAGPNGASIALSHVRPLGTVPAHDLAALLARQPIYASLALYEPFGLAVLEAAWAGCPLVLSDIPTFRELWDGAALFVSRDERAVAAALDGLAADTSARARLGAAARERAGCYSLDRTVEGTIAAYEDLLRRPAGSLAA